MALAFTFLYAWTSVSVAASAFIRLIVLRSSSLSVAIAVDLAVVSVLSLVAAPAASSSVVLLHSVLPALCQCVVSAVFAYGVDAFPRSFTLGEALLVAQGVGMTAFDLVLYSIHCVRSNPCGGRFAPVAADSLTRRLLSVCGLRYFATAQRDTRHSFRCSRAPGLMAHRFDRARRLRPSAPSWCRWRSPRVCSARTSASCTRHCHCSDDRSTARSTAVPCVCCPVPRSRWLCRVPLELSRARDAQPVRVAHGVCTCASVARGAHRVLARVPRAARAALCVRRRPVRDPHDHRAQTLPRARRRYVCPSVRDQRADARAQLRRRSECVLPPRVRPRRVAAARRTPRRCVHEDVHRPSRRWPHRLDALVLAPRLCTPAVARTNDNNRHASARSKRWDPCARYWRRHGSSSRIDVRHAPPHWLQDARRHARDLCLDRDCVLVVPRLSSAASGAWRLRAGTFANACMLLQLL